MPSTTIFSSKKSQMIELLHFTSDRSWKQDYNRQTERIFTCNSYFVVLLHLMSIFVHRKKVCYEEYTSATCHIAPTYLVDYVN